MKQAGSSGTERSKQRGAGGKKKPRSRITLPTRRGSPIKLSWPFMVRRIRGKSMTPGLLPGQIILGWRWFHRLQPTDIVIFEHAGRQKIKRIQDARPKEIFVVGDNTDHSTDSRDFGWLNKSCVQARLLYVIPSRHPNRPA